MGSIARLGLWLAAVILASRIASAETLTIGGGDVESIAVEPGNSEDNSHVIAIKLRAGKKIRSPELAGSDPAEALRTEIMRRLNFPQGVRTPTE